MLKKRSFRKPKKPETVEMLVEQYDAAARDAAMRWRSVSFDHSPETIAMLEEMLEELHGELNKKSFGRKIGLGTSEVDIAQWANLWGIYLGESLRLRLGGKWIIGHEEAPSLVALEFPDGTVAFPTARVFRRLSDGPKENVVEYYEMLVREMRDEI
jgi:hypothetical protein